MEWRRCMNTLVSSTSTDRIRGLKTLFTLLDSFESLEELENAEERVDISLNEVFEVFHRVLVKAVSGVHAKKGRGVDQSTSSPIVNSELKKVFTKLLAKSGEYVHRISADNLLTSLNQIFSSVHLRLHFGGTYYRYIVTMLLKKRTYWGEITGKGWRDLIRVSIIAYNDDIVGLDKSKVVKSIGNIISQGSFNSELSLWISGKEAFIMDVVLSTNMGVTHAAECTLMMALSYATKEIAKENRELSCKFGENVLDIVLKCYDPTASEVKMLKSLVLEFLIFQLKIHHPNGATIGSVGAYAHDHHKWENGLKQMYFLMREEMTLVRKRLSTEEPLLGRFLEFAVEVSYQMMNLPGKESDTDGPSNVAVAKESGMQMVISLLHGLPEQSAWPWLYIISFLIRKYHCLDEYYYIPLLDNLAAFISLSKDYVTLDCLFRCCCSVAEVRILSLDNMQKCETYWQKIWDLAVWAIGLKHCEDSAHETIRAILTTNCFTLKNQISELFNMYLTDRMTLSEGSIKTLHCLLISFDIVDSMDLTARESCMKWVYLVKGKPEAFQGMLPVELIAEILVQLCLKGRLKRVPPMRNDCRVDPLEHFYSQLSFCDGLLISCTSSPRNPECRTRGDVSLEDSSFNTLKSMVIEDGESVVAWVNALLVSGARKEGVSGAEFLSFQLQVLMLISSILIGCGVCSPTAAEIGSCLNVFKILLDSFTDLLEAIVKIPQLKNELTKTFGNLAALYGFQINDNIMSFVRENTSRKLIKIVMGVITGGADYYSILDSQVYSESTCLISIGCKIMGGFCCKYDNKPYLPQQKEVLAYFIGRLSKETNEVGFPLRLQMLMEFLYLPIGRLAINVEFLALTLSKFEGILAMHSNDVELLQIALSLLKDIASNAVSNSAFQGIIVRSSEFYLERLYMGILKRKLPPSIAVKVAHLLGTLIKINSELTWPWLLSADRKQITISNLMLQEIDNPYAEVRMVVAENLYNLLHPLRFPCTAEKRSGLNLWLKYLTNSCLEEKSISGEKGGGNNLKITLHCLCVMAVAAPLLRKKAIFSLLRLINIHHICPALGKRIISLLGEELKADSKAVICAYLHDFLEKWILLSDIKVFPYWVAYNCIKEFYLENAGVIFTTLWMANHESLDEFCHIIEKNVSEVFKDHSALLLALSMSQYLCGGNEHEMAVGRQTAQSVIDQIIKVHPDLNLYQALSTSNSILYVVCKLFHDEEKVAMVTEDSMLLNCDSKLCYPERSSHRYTNEMVLKLFEYLFYWNKESKGVKYMDYIIRESPSHLRYVLLRLANDVINASTPCVATTALVAFQFYVEYVMEHVAGVQEAREKMCMRKLVKGIVRDASFSLFRVIKRWCSAENDTVCTLAFIYLQKDLIEYFVPPLKGLQVVLVPIVYTLVDLINDDCMKHLEEHVLKLIESLLNTKSLKEDLFYLVPFPSCQKFKNLNVLLNRIGCGSVRTSLSKNLVDFLEAHNIFGFTRIEMLQHVQSMLKEKKAELKYLYDEIEEKSDSFEKYSGSVLHRTICLLAKLCTTSDQVIRTEAAKCLAELGPGYLRAPVLVPEITESTARSLHKNQLHKLTLKCLELLPMYLLDPSMEVVEVTSTALMAIINSKEGQATLRGEWPCQLKLAEDYTILEKNFSIKICLSPLEFNEKAFFETRDLWIPSGDFSHSKWIMALVTALLCCFTSVSSYLEKLIKICCLKVSLCEEIFPFILEIFLHCGQVSCQLMLFERIRHFFKVTYDSFTTKTGRCSLKEPLIRNKATVVTMLNVVNYLNLQHHGTQVKDSGMNAVDAIDYLHCAVAAQQCSAYFSAIQYCTLWLSQVSKGNESNNLSFHMDVGTPHVDEILLVLRKCHAGLGDTDDLYGCGTLHLLEPVGRIEHFKNLEKWEEVMRYYELELSDSDDKSAVEGLLMSMQMLGMEELLMGLLETREQEDMLSYKYECGWRLCSWDLLSKFSEKTGHTSARFLLEDIPKVKTKFQIDEKKMNVEFHRNLFLAIRSVQNGKYTDSLNQLADARECVIDLISLASLEACQNIYCPITRLHALKMIEEFASSFEVSKESALKYILSEWKHIDLLRVNIFEKVEPHKALSLTLLKSCFFERNGNMSAWNMNETPAISMAEIQLQLGCSAREVGMYSIAEKYLRAVRKIPGLELKPLMLIRLQFEEAQLLWAKGYGDIAKVLMNSVVDIVDKLPMDESLARCHATALTLQGHWVMKTHSKGAKDTLSKYFGHAEDLLNEYKVERNSQEYLNAVRAMAEYADEQYVLTSKYINSSSYAKKQQYASHSMHIVSDFEGANRVTSDERRSIMLLEKQAELDEKELEECKADQTSYMEIALSHYIKFLIYSPKIELEIVFRFVSLFLESYSNEESIFAEIEKIPSYKFIRVVPQLLPRIVLSKGNCSRILKSILEKSALHHPHHVLPHIFALAYSLKDLEKGKGSDAFITETQKANQIAAKQMVEKLRKNQTLTEYVKELSSLWEALISLAYLPVNAKRIENTMGTNVLLMKLTNLSHVQVPTVKLTESPTGEYNCITSVWKYLPTFTLVGGINVPKKITCQGSDGNNYPQLLKGRDDLRQDAVMQQVFDLINCLLHKDKNAWKRRLRIRTYGVVPLSHRSGIIEWCSNTISIGNYLHGVKNFIGAHSKFNPSDYPIRTCRNMMMDVQKSTKKIKLQVYLEICENLQPVFRHYFFSKFPNPGIWYEMRQSYTRSVATSSIIGYVLGLGDRHVQNILIDESTAEVLHVDLGIAFEQGKTLNTPESVPFRLTRDIVDGMGICGIEGVFKKSCEVTMALMRKYYQIILTVLEVLIYDPLYVWTLKPKYKMLGVDNKGGPVGSGPLTMKPSGDRVAAVFPTTVTHSLLSSAEPQSKLRTSKGSSRASTSTSGQANFTKTEDSLQNVERNPIAMRAMERLEQKLMGTENGPPASSVKAQVERLIQEAQDPENLCILYPGWQPYL